MATRWSFMAWVSMVVAVALGGCVGPEALPGAVETAGTLGSDATPGATDATDAAPAPAKQHAPPPAVGECVDLDRDGFGLGCGRGVDCDDRDPRVTTECHRCMRPGTGCACGQGLAPVPCDVTTDGPAAAPGGTCMLGQRTCRDGRWSRCEAYRPAFHRVVGTASDCPGSCLPGCRHVVDCLEPGDPMPAGSAGVTLANLGPAVFCPAGTQPGGVGTFCRTSGLGPYVRGTSPLTWFDACNAPGHGTYLSSSDDGTVNLTMPFPFAYYGVLYTTVGIGANGTLSFSTPSSLWTNFPAPFASVPNTVFPFWDDLVQRDGVCVATFGTAPTRRFVVEWHDAFFYYNDVPETDLTFEAVLSENTNTIDLLYRTMVGEGDRATGSSATIALQEGAGTSYDQVGYNTPGTVTTGSSIRWTPVGGTTTCDPGVYTRTFEASCPDSGGRELPLWGQFNYTSVVPSGSAIRFEVRVANDAAALAAATPIPLPRAPDGVPASPTSMDLGAILRTAGAGNEVARYVQLTAFLDPNQDRSLAPLLGSTEVQFTCTPHEYHTTCAAGTACDPGDPCATGTIACDGTRPVCVPVARRGVGATCGTGRVCDSAGACIACAEGTVCSTGNPCTAGRISCASGAPVCTTASFLPAGTTCGTSSGAYNRGAIPFYWHEACSMAGHNTFLVGVDDGTATDTLPFPFPYYALSHTTVGLSSNGIFSFGMPTPAASNTALPGAAANSVYAFWDDIYPRNGVCTVTIGTAPNRLYVAQWDDARYAETDDSTAHLSFEVVLSEAYGTIDVLYRRMEGSGSRSSGASATIGMQLDTGSTYDQFSYNTAGAVGSNAAIRWSPGVTAVCSNAGTCVACTGLEVCDGLDNDCDGIVDDGIAPIVCGVGACQRSVPGCIRGATPACTPGAPAAEVCDRMDNDCDGLEDEDVYRPCYTGPAGTLGVGACRGGQNQCSAGAWGAACAGEVLPSVEMCNGVDDDCDGTVDELCNGWINCPAARTMYSGETVPFAVTSAGISTFTWAITSAPSGSTTSARWSPASPTGASASMTPFIVGAYTVRVSGTDPGGTLRSCTYNVTALPRGLRVEVTWDGPGDVDLHLHNASGTPWFTSNDCYYNNATTAWGATLDVDDTDGNGPESIRMDSPVVGMTYTIGVHNFRGAGGRVATVRVYCGSTGGTTPTAVFTSRALNGSGSGDCSANDFWRTARVTFTSPGACSIVPVNLYAPASSYCSAP